MISKVLKEIILRGGISRSNAYEILIQDESIYFDDYTPDGIIQWLIDYKYIEHNIHTDMFLPIINISVEKLRDLRINKLLE